MHVYISSHVAPELKAITVFLKPECDTVVNDCT